MLPHYERLLDHWKLSRNRQNLTRDDFLRIQNSLSPRRKEGCHVQRLTKCWVLTTGAHPLLRHVDSGTRTSRCLTSVRAGRRSTRRLRSSRVGPVHIQVQGTIPVPLCAP
jgi:hypothetical protein